MVPGTTQAYTEANIYARASGYVARRLVDIGDRVHTGQLMAVIDAPDLDQQVAQARSSLRQSESNLAQMQAQLHLNSLNWDRYKVLVAKGVFPGRTVTPRRQTSGSPKPTSRLRAILFKPTATVWNDSSYFKDMSASQRPSLA